MQQNHKSTVATRQPIIQNDHLTGIEKIIDIIGQETNKIKVLSAVLRFTLAIKEVEAGALLVIDNEIKNMVVVTRHGIPDELMGQLTKGKLGHLLLKGQSLHLETGSTRPNPYQNILAQHKLNYLLGLPLQFDGHILGAIVIGSRKLIKYQYHQNLQRKLATLAQIVAMYLDNIRLRTSVHFAAQEKVKPAVETPNNNPNTVDELEELLTALMSAEEEVFRQNTDLGVLNTLSTHMGSSLQLKTVLELAIKDTQHALGLDACWCYLFENDVLVLREHQGLSEHYVENMSYLKPGTGAEGMAFSRNEPVFRDGLLFHSGKARTVVKEEGLGAVAAVPLMNRDITFGVLGMANRQITNWSPREERMMISISRQVAQAIANSQLFTDAQEKAENWESGYTALQQANQKLTKRNAFLEQQIKDLHQAEKQIWMALAASNEARRQLSDAQADNQLRATLERILGKLSNHQSLISKS